MTIFKPCIDLHGGKVKQIVGESLAKDDTPTTNFVSDQGATWFASKYKEDHLKGGHVIMLGPGNESEAKAALREYPGGLQIGGGINIDNAMEYLELGASHVIITSWVIPEKTFDYNRLEALSRKVGKHRIVLDLSCRRDALRGGDWYVAKDKWQTITDEKLEKGLIESLEKYCDEFLIHAADVEGKTDGIDEELVTALASWVTIPTTYAGGAKSIDDLQKVKDASRGSIDLTIGSALDLFGGSLIKYEDCLRFNNSEKREESGIRG